MNVFRWRISHNIESKERPKLMLLLQSRFAYDFKGSPGLEWIHTETVHCGMKESVVEKQRTDRQTLTRTFIWQTLWDRSGCLQAHILGFCVRGQIICRSVTKLPPNMSYHLPSDDRNILLLIVAEVNKPVLAETLQLSSADGSTGGCMPHFCLTMHSPSVLVCQTTFLFCWISVRWIYGALHLTSLPTFQDIPSARRE